MKNHENTTLKESIAASVHYILVSIVCCRLLVSATERWVFFRISLVSL